jgi:hypothetical protein
MIPGQPATCTWPTRPWLSWQASHSCRYPRQQSTPPCNPRATAGPTPPAEAATSITRRCPGS